MNRRRFASWLIALACGVSLALPVTDTRAADDAVRTYRVYFGTYTRRGKSEGIYLSELDTKTGTLTEPRLVAKVVNPSFLAIHPSQKFLYAVSEISNLQGKKVGGVSAFAIDAKTGDLKPLNQQSSGGAGPCHLVVDATGRNVLVANYGGGSVACLPIDEDGSLQEASAFVQHEGSSVNPRRQKGPHAHSINVDPRNRYAVAADLGLDEVLVYRFDPKAGKLTPNDPAFEKVRPGGGPRHFDFHPGGRFAYSNNEMTSEVNVFAYHAKTGDLDLKQTLSTLPEDFEGNNSTAETRVHPNGRFVYVSNRGHDSIAVFSVDRETGKLTFVEHESTRGKTPRNFCLDPGGTFLLAANQSTDDVHVFRVDRQSGALEPTGVKVQVGSPVCVRFVPKK